MSNYRQVHRSRRTEEATAESDELPPHLRKLEDRLLADTQQRHRESKLKGWHNATISGRSKKGPNYFARLERGGIGISVLIERSGREEFGSREPVSIHIGDKTTKSGIPIADAYQRIAGSQQHTEADSRRELARTLGAGWVDRAFGPDLSNRPGGSETIDGVIGANGKYISRGPPIPEGEGFVNRVWPSNRLDGDPVTKMPSDGKIVIMNLADPGFYLNAGEVVNARFMITGEAPSGKVLFSERYQPVGQAIAAAAPQQSLAQIVNLTPVPQGEPVTGVIEHLAGRVLLRPAEGNKIVFLHANPNDFKPGSRDSATITRKDRLFDYSDPGFYGPARK